MMRINLLPVRAARRRVSARQELLILGGVLVILLAGLGMWWSLGAVKAAEMRERIEGVRGQLQRLSSDVTRVKDFKTKTELLERKLRVIDELELRKVGPARMLDDLATILTDERKVWLTRLEEKDGLLILEGGAMEEENVSAFQIALGKRSRLFTEIKLTLVSAQKKAGVPHLEWKMTCKTNYVAG